MPRQRAHPLGARGASGVERVEIELRNEDGARDAMPVGDIGRDLTEPGRVLVGHPFNPPYLIPLVEVVGGMDTDPEVVDWTSRFFEVAGKSVIRMDREVPGFVGNRLQEALWREALHMVDSGEATVQQIDDSITYGPGLRWALMGPHLTFHLAGGEGGMTNFMHHLTPALVTWIEDLGDPKFTPELQKKIIDGVADEAAGRSIADLQKWRDRKLIDVLKISAEG